MNTDNKKTILVGFWSEVFNKLRWISFFHIICYFFPSKKPFLFVDLWILINLLIAFTLFLTKSAINNLWIKYSLIGYGLIRTFELFIYLVNVLIFDPYRTKNYKVRSYNRLLIALFHNYFEVTLWFASFYIILSDNILTNFKFSYLEQFMESFKIMFTFNSDKIIPLSNLGYTLISYQIFIGLTMTILILSRFLGFLPPISTLDKNEM